VVVEEICGCFVVAAATNSQCMSIHAYVAAGGAGCIAGAALRFRNTCVKLGLAYWAASV
jgi:hypothetical protein